MQQIRTTLLAIAVTAALGGCATTAPRAVQDSGSTPPSGPVEVGGSGATSAVNITPLSDYLDDWATHAPKGDDFSDAYTRLLILSNVSADGGVEADRLNYDGRGWLARALVERDFSINLTAKVTAGSFEATVPLATVSHQSGSEGEQWGRVIHHSQQNFPLFLVPASGSASTPTMKISVNGDRSYSSRAAATAVQVALNVANITGQTSRVITALSADSARDQARAMDEAISRLFGSALSEEHWSDRDLRYWSADDQARPRGARVTFKIPKNSKDWNSPPLRVGEWTITFDYPRPSVFSDWRICGSHALPRCVATRAQAKAKVTAEVSAGEILNYPVAPGTQGLGTIRAYLAQKDWFTSSQTAMNDANKRTAAASNLCRMIVNEMTGIGLNGFDADLVVWAVVNGMPIGNVQAMRGAQDCKRSLAVVGAERASQHG